MLYNPRGENVMTDTDLALIARRIAALKAELTELETAAKVLRRLSADTGRGREITTARKKKGTTEPRLTITDAATSILTGLNGKPEHYAVIAKEAMKLGYKGKTRSTEDQLKKAFWATMKRQPEIFESTGDGRFRLKAK
jgi:hypothetical protein